MYLHRSKVWLEVVHILLPLLFSKYKYSRVYFSTPNPPKKKKKRGNSLPLHEEEQEEEETCLLSLFEENTCQEPYGITKPLPAHPTTAAAAAVNQAPLAPANSPTKEKAKNDSTPNRNVRLTRIKPGFELETEMQLCRIFHRPPRTYHEDLPFYPWLPPAPTVIFNLNYKG